MLGGGKWSWPLYEFYNFTQEACKQAQMKGLEETNNFKKDTRSLSSILFELFTKMLQKREKCVVMETEKNRS